MKKRVILESLAIVAVLATLLSSSALAAYPGPDTDPDTEYGAYSSYVYASVTGTYATGYPSQYNHAYFAVSRSAGQAYYDGYLWFEFNIAGQQPIQWYTAGSEYHTDSPVSANGLTCESWSNFYRGSEHWGVSAYGYVHT
jgi:hypothetical protein